MLPNSSRMYVSIVNCFRLLRHWSRATVAGDRQVRVFDHERAAGNPVHTGETEYSARAAAIHVIRCHSGRVKRIVTEDSPDLFLTVAEVSPSHERETSCLPMTVMIPGRDGSPARPPSATFVRGKAILSRTPRTSQRRAVFDLSFTLNAVPICSSRIAPIRECRCSSVAIYGSLKSLSRAISSTDVMLAVNSTRNGDAHRPRMN